MSSPFSLTDAVVLVTGAAGGIGESVALTLAAAGARVACVDLSLEAVTRVHERIEAAGGRSTAIAADVTDPKRMAGAVQAAERLGPLTGAANCAGINFQVSAEDMSIDEWRRLIDVNLTGIFVSCQAEGRAMLANGGGSIVNIGSISATIANRGLAQTHYNASKAAVLQFTRSLALEWADRGVRVNSVSPGYTLTPMATDPTVWEHVKRYVDDIPLARMADPREIAMPVQFLLSSASSYVTGTELLVDGGAVGW